MEHLPQNINKSILKNATGQIVGRFLLSFARFGISLLIIRYTGTERYGEYALILSQLMIAEWIVDFGCNEIAIRNICQAPKEEGPLMSALALAKGLQSIIGFLAVIGILYAMSYDAHIIRAGAIGGLGVFCYAGILVYRALFRIKMVMERDVLAEIIGVLVMLPLVWLASTTDASLELLVGCYLVSRIVFFLSALAMGYKEGHISPWRARKEDLRGLLAQAVPLGFSGVLVVLYGSMDHVFLSKMVDFRSVGYYAYAMSLVFPTTIVVQSISNTVYPLLSSYWQKDPVLFGSTQQGALDTSIFLSVGMVCFFNVSAEFLMGLVNPEMVEAAYILRFLSWIILARAVTAMMTPLIVVAGGQKHTLWLTILVVAFKAVFLTIFIPVYGMMGAIVGYMVSEMVVSMIPTIAISQALTKIRMSWAAMLKSLGTLAAVLGLCQVIGLTGTLIGGLLAVFFYTVAGIGVGIISLKRIQGFIGNAQDATAKTS